MNPDEASADAERLGPAPPADTTGGRRTCRFPRFSIARVRAEARGNVRPKYDYPMTAPQPGRDRQCGAGRSVFRALSIKDCAWNRISRNPLDV
jgi:hypothetical protein